MLKLKLGFFIVGVCSITSVAWGADLSEPYAITECQKKELFETIETIIKNREAVLEPILQTILSCLEKAYDLLNAPTISMHEKEASIPFLRHTYEKFESSPHYKVLDETPDLMINNLTVLVRMQREDNVPENVQQDIAQLRKKCAEMVRKNTEYHDRARIIGEKVRALSHESEQKD
jgi:hypothetical protein